MGEGGGEGGGVCSELLNVDVAATKSLDILRCHHNVYEMFFCIHFYTPQHHASLH